MSSRRPITLCILDGWGEGDSTTSNAISEACTPSWDALIKASPLTYLEASGAAVGLPEGQMGNSEVGHTAIGSGRVVLQDLIRLNETFGSGDFEQNEVLKDFAAKLKATGGVCHLAGLYSPGGIHSHCKHIDVVAAFLERQGIDVKLHLWLDGRDTPPESAAGYIEALESRIADTKNISIATLSGRFYGMDRDKRWDRTQLAYSAMVFGEGVESSSALEAVENSYAAGVTDEFVKPVVLPEYQGMQDGDGILIANFRADRMRQICGALCDPAFQEFERSKVIKFSTQAGMMSYSSTLDKYLSVLYPPYTLKNVLGEVVANAGLRQLRIAETEKYAHVTFFLNGGEETVFPGEERILVPSPKVATYDLQPAMSAEEVTDRLIEANQKEPFDLTVVNYANPDMVGHTGNLEATIEAIEVVDKCLGRLLEFTQTINGLLIVTADHGNAEQMKDPKTQTPFTAHTCNPVPFVLHGLEDIELAAGALSDVGPTVLGLLGLKKPSEMTGTSLIGGKNV